MTRSASLVCHIDLEENRDVSAGKVTGYGIENRKFSVHCNVQTKFRTIQESIQWVMGGSSLEDKLAGGGS
jgi:hypothetical protein